MMEPGWSRLRATAKINEASSSPKYNDIIVMITQNWYISLSNLNVIHSLQ